MDGISFSLSEASLNRFVTGQLGLGTGQDRARSGMEIPSKRPASLITSENTMCVWKSGASRQPGWLYLIGEEKLAWEGFYRGRWGGGDGIPESQGTPALGTQTRPRGKATRGNRLSTKHHPWYASYPAIPFVPGLDLFHLQKKKIIIYILFPF